MQGKLPAILLAALAILAGAWLLFGEQQSATDDNAAGQRLFPELEQTLNDIARIRVEHSGDVYEVVKQGDQWQLPGKGGYPVLFEQVKPVLLGIALLDKVEAKTSKPENYDRLGVQEPTADSGNMRLDLYTSGDTPVASLIVGGIRRGLFAGGKDGIYARVSGEARAWLVAGNLDLPQDPVDWVDRMIIQLKPKDVKRVNIRQTDGSSLVVERPHKGAPNFAVVDLPEGVAVKGEKEIDGLAKPLAGLNMDDVLPRAKAALSEADAVAAVFETWDGLQVTAYTIEQEGKIFVWFDVGVAALDVNDLSKVRTTQTDDAELRAQLDGWVYQIPRSRGAKLRTRLDDVIASPAANQP